MSGFLYYLPNQTRAAAKLAELRKQGLGYAFERNATPREVLAGPGGAAGVVLGDPARLGDRELGYFPQAQTWRKIPATPAWVGMYTAAPPGPKDLEKARTLGGHWVELLDEQPWLVAVARCYIEQDGELRWYANFPQRVSLGADGRWTRSEVQARYAAVWELANAWEDAKAAAVIGKEADEDDGETIRFTFDHLLDGAVAALGTNYRLGPAEADLLGLLTEELAIEVLDALIDLPARLAWLKKKEEAAAAAAGSRTDAGPPAETPATVPR